MDISGKKYHDVDVALMKKTLSEILFGGKK